MWIILGIGAIVSAIINVVWTIRQKEAKVFRFISLSLTSLTLCAGYDMMKNWILAKDLRALMDAVPGMTRCFWGLVVISILINSISLFSKRDYDL